MNAWLSSLSIQAFHEFWDEHCLSTPKTSFFDMWMTGQGHNKMQPQLEKVLRKNSRWFNWQAIDFIDTSRSRMDDQSEEWKGRLKQSNPLASIQQQPILHVAHPPSMAQFAQWRSLWLVLKTFLLVLLTQTENCLHQAKLENGWVFSFLWVIHPTNKVMCLFNKMFNEGHLVHQLLSQWSFSNSEWSAKEWWKTLTIFEFKKQTEKWVNQQLDTNHQSLLKEWINTSSKHGWLFE